MAVRSPHIEERPFVSHYIVSYNEDEQERCVFVYLWKHEIDMLSLPNRLNSQNRYFTQVLCEGQLIVPKISLDPKDVILESATGTGPCHSLN